MGQFNLLKDAYAIKNTSTCRYDSLTGYTTDFSTNGDVNGWDIYNNVCLYGAWGSVLFGTSIDRECYIGRSNPFTPVQAEKYHVLKLTMKMTLPDNYGKKLPPTKGKIMWTEAADPTWLADHSVEFDLNITDQWYTYVINLGEAKYWIGDINNLRLFPTLNGFPDIKFMIKDLVIDSVSTYTCLNTQCSYYTQFSHPCAGAGRRASIKSETPKGTFTTVSGVSDKLILDIDDYGPEQVNLGHHENLSGVEMAKVIVDRISRVNLGQYAYAEVTYLEEDQKLTIYSGAMYGDSTIALSGSAAEPLGFINTYGETTATFEDGVSSATGFDFGSSRRLKGFELNALIDSNLAKSAYYHNPNQYNVEAGRRDFSDSMSSNYAANADKVDHYELLDGAQKLLIDGSHPINDSGRLSTIWVNGEYVTDKGSTFSPKIFILRPDKYNNAIVVAELDIAIENESLRYTTDHVTFRTNCSVLVNKGDLIGFFNLNVLVPYSTRKGEPNAVYFQVACGSNGPSSEKFDIGQPMSQGVIGMSFYARSSRIQKDIQLDIDIGERTNIEEISVYGKELSNAFEYNVACCLDVNWSVDCHNYTHWHAARSQCNVVVTLVHVKHQNIPYGVECLSDCVTTPDGGQVGTSFSTSSMGPTRSDGGFGSVSDSDPGIYSGIKTYGYHSYCYVNGDAEWLNGGCNSGDTQAEFRDPWVADVSQFEFDPISYYLIFPAGKELNIHRSIIYFKETQNFKRYSLSYYLGEDGEAGNAEELNFNYVPSYNNVIMDGLTVTADQGIGNTITQVYTDTLFSNPTPWAIPEYVGEVCTNWDIYQTVMNTQMNILEHNFDAVSCKGFKIHSTWHKSTKLTEIELYSKTLVEPTLLDNVRVQTSVYGEDWRELSFTQDEVDLEKISAYVPASPRYFRLQLQSQDIFELKELSAAISDEHIKSLDCTDIVLQDNAPKGVMTTSKKLDIENTYDIPLDLLVEIPRQLFKEQYVLSWIKFASEDTAFNGEIGPGALIRKSPDYPLYLENGQVAINTPSYYLKNLVDNKQSYVFENEHAWEEYKTLGHGEDVDYTNIPAGKVTSLGFLPVSSKYWKLSVHEAKSYTINGIKAYHNEDSTIVPVTPNTDFTGITEMDPALWGGTPDVLVENDKLLLITAPGGYTYKRSKFVVNGDFEIYIGGSAKTHPASSYLSGPILKILDTNLTDYIQFYYSAYLNATLYPSSDMFVFNYRKDGVSKTIDTWGSSYEAHTAGEHLKLKRVGDVFTAYFSSSSTGTYTVMDPPLAFTNFSKDVYIDLALWNNPSSAGTMEAYIDKFEIISGKTYFSDLNSEFMVAGPVTLDRVYIQAQPGNLSAKYETTFDKVTSTINPVVLIEDDFSDGDWYSNWLACLGNVPDNDFIEKENAIYPFMGANQTISIEQSFLPGANSFECEVHFNLDFPTEMVYTIELLTPENEVSTVMRLTGYGTNEARLAIQSPISKEQEFFNRRNIHLNPLIYKNSTFTKSSSQYKDGFIFTCNKNYNSYTKLSLTNTVKTTSYYNSTSRGAPPDRVSKLRITYTNLATINVVDQSNNYGTTFVRFVALPRLSDKESIVFGFDNSQPMNALKIVQPTGNIDYSSISISGNDSDDYAIWAKSFSKYSGDLTSLNYKVTGSNMVVDVWANHGLVWQAFDDQSTGASTGSYYVEHWIAYDFGAGNAKKIRGFRFNASSTYPQFPVAKVYGTNTYQVDFIKLSYDVYDPLINLSDATLLTEFNIIYSIYDYILNEGSFVNDTKFRYIIFYFPHTSDYVSHRIAIKEIDLYEEYNLSNITGIVTNNVNYTNYMAIDLEKPHNLDFLRNYGPKSSLYNLYNLSLLDYSNSDTPNIDEVSWSDDAPVILFNFNTLIMSNNLYKTVYVYGYNEIGSYNAPVGGNYLWLGPRMHILYTGETTRAVDATGGAQYVGAVRNFTYVNCTGITKQTTKLVIDLKVGDFANIDHGQLEVSSSSYSDQREWQYAFSRNGADPLNLIGTVDAEYKEFELPLSFFGDSATVPDIRYIRRIRFYITTVDGGNSLGWRNARFVDVIEDCHLSIDYDSTMLLADNDFTIDFWAKRSRLGAEGIIGQIDNASVLSTFSFTFNDANYLIATFYSEGTIYELKSLVAYEDNDWHHIAVCRDGAYLLFYVDGIAQTSRDIGVGLEINECVQRLYIGKVDAFYFHGYLDEFRVLIGKATWKSNFIVPTTGYSVTGRAGDKTSARWVRIPFVCGDGTTRNINKLGIYPNISVPFIPSGGYNCEWSPIENDLSNYDTMIRNLSPTASIISDSLIEDTFEEQSLDNWINLEGQATTALIKQTDFTEENPENFWAEVHNNLTSPDSSIIYTGSSLVASFSYAAEDCTFYTEYVYGPCQAVVDFTHSTQQEIGNLYTMLSVHVEDGNYYEIRIHKYSTDTTVEVYVNGSRVTDNNYAGIHTALMLKRYIGYVEAYAKINGVWIKVKTLTYDSLLGGQVRFRLRLYKDSNYPEVDFVIHSVSLTDLDAYSEPTEWGLVSSDYGNYAIGYKTTDIPTQDGPIFTHPTLIAGSKIDYFEYYYLNTGAGGGVSLMDTNGNEVLGLATASPVWFIKDNSGWEAVNLSPPNGNSSWYRVRATFDWEAGTVVVEWEDLSTNLISTYNKELMSNTEVAKFQIKGFLGSSWGVNSLDIKFDNISVLPTTGHLYEFDASNCLSGDLSAQGFENCWGFSGDNINPVLTLDLGAAYRIGEFKLYHRPFDNNYDYVINDFNIYGATTTSGAFELLVQETGYTEDVSTEDANIYKLDNPKDFRVIKLEILAFTKPNAPLMFSVGDREDTGDYIVVDGGFLREFEIWSTPVAEVLNSEDHPIICMDLLDQFNLTYHKIEGPNDDNNWSNDNQFYQFSGDNSPDPEKVAFSEGYDYTFAFDHTAEYMIDSGGPGSYVLSTDVFLASGYYEVNWQSYNAQEEGAIILNVLGMENIELKSKNKSSSWGTQFNEFYLNTSDYYTIQVKSLLNVTQDKWGVKNINFKNFSYTSRWVALRRNTATNFVWDSGAYNETIDNAAGVDIIKSLKIYAAESHRPTEYHWMWSSLLSTFENDVINTKVGKRSLKINYPASETVDTINFLEGDYFGHDASFSIKDALSLWLYVSDIDKLYVDGGGFAFGSFDGYIVPTTGDLTADDSLDSSGNPSADAATYIWKFKDLGLKTGWNQVKLRFDQSAETIPEALTNSGKLSSELNFREHVTSSFGMVFRGKGEAFYMLLDDLRIERNWFYDEVVFGQKGLCLTWNDYAEIPLSGMDTRYGTIETWVKLYSSTAGLDHFNNVASRTLFTLVDTANNSISLSMRSNSWFEIGVGNTKSEYKTLFLDPKEVSIGSAAFQIDDILHIALVWSNDAEQMDNNDTIRLYINGNLYLRGKVTWDVGDSKNVLLRLGGGNTYLANNDDADGSAIFSEVKFYNYCKTEFEINKQVPTDVENLTPNDFVQVSKDDVEFYGTRSTELPLEFNQVAPGEKIPIYIRVDKTRVDELDRLTGSINVEWKVPV